MEKLKAFWDIIAPYISGGLMGGIITMVILPFIKGKITKGFAKIDFKGFLEECREAIREEGNKVIERLKGTVLTHSIEPLVLSEMQKVHEDMNAKVEETTAEMKGQLSAVLTVLKAQAAYFDDSTVGGEKKAALHAAIENAEKVFAPKTVESVVEVSEVAAPKKSVKAVEVYK